MTTPQNFRRRQRIEGVALLLLGVFVCVITYIDDRQDEQREANFQACLIEEFAELSEAQIARGDIAARQSDAVADVIKSVGLAMSTGDFETIESVLNNYAVVQSQIDADREANPFPPFPEGECDV